MIDKHDEKQLDTIKKQKSKIKNLKEQPVKEIMRKKNQTRLCS